MSQSLIIYYITYLVFNKIIKSLFSGHFAPPYNFLFLKLFFCVYHNKRKYEKPRLRDNYSACNMNSKFCVYNNYNVHNLLLSFCTAFIKQISYYFTSLDVVFFGGWIRIKQNSFNFINIKFSNLD